MEMKPVKKQLRVAMLVWVSLICFVPTTMALQIGNRHCLSLLGSSHPSNYPLKKPFVERRFDNEDDTKAAKKYKRSLKKILPLINVKKGMLVFRSQADFFHVLCLVDPTFGPKGKKIETEMPAERSQILVLFLERKFDHFHSLYNSPFGIPDAWKSVEFLAIWLNKDQALLIGDQIFAFNGPEEIFLLLASKNQSFRMLRQHRLDEKLPAGSELILLSDKLPFSGNRASMDDQKRSQVDGAGPYLIDSNSTSAKEDQGHIAQVHEARNQAIESKSNARKPEKGKKSFLRRTIKHAVGIKRTFLILFGALAFAAGMALGISI